MAEDNKPFNRRSFFRQGLRELLKPLAQAAEPLEEIARQFGAAENTPQRPPVGKKWLRPPGALLEPDFIDQCSRCGECVRICPAECIKIDPTHANGEGAPYIEPNEMPCVMCDGLLCMNVCPTGAIQPTPLILVDMGTAQWKPDTCLRSRAEPCTICIDDCPIGSRAIDLTNNRVTVYPDGCTGCGVCQNHCPTSPKSIVVLPKAAR